MNKIKAVILKNETDSEHFFWVSACSKYGEKIHHEVVDITKNDWLEKVVGHKPDILLTKPGGFTSPFKQLYDERLMILVRELGYPAFPSLEEVLIYENKRYLSYWLKSHNIPHPKTDVFYFEEEAVDFLKRAEYPLIGKVGIGAAGSGVTFIDSIDQGHNYVERIFSGLGAIKRNGPNLKKGGLFARGIYYLFHPLRITNKLKEYRSRAGDIQKDFVLFQEFVPHQFEWRVVRIGNSFFAHKKLKSGRKASGSLKKDYDNPSIKILDFVKDITDRFCFFSMAVDIFETESGFLINELQCIFGQSDPYQMMIDKIPGRYQYINNKWVFEEGDFNTNESFDLRLLTAIELYGEE